MRLECDCRDNNNNNNVGDDAVEEWWYHYPDQDRDNSFVVCIVCVCIGLVYKRNKTSFSILENSL